MVVKACYNLSQLKLSNCPAFIPIVGSAAVSCSVSLAPIEQPTDLVRQEQEGGSRFQS